MYKQLLIIAIAAISMCSCVKIHQCECVYKTDGVITDTEMKEFPGTKKLTKQMCEDHEDDLNEIKFDPEEVIECTQKS